MKALSLWQPWATLVAIGAKKYETRSWATSYRGPLAIHAAKRFSLPERQLALSGWFRFRLTEAGYNHTKDFPRGAYVAVVDLVDVLPAEIVKPSLDVVELSFGNFSPGRFAWKLANLRRIQPVPARGYQGLWNLDQEVIVQLERAVL